MARKKNAPVLKNNLRDVPADKFRAVNRMNGIVTMVEYTSEDDIKAYELEPTYRELGGGGGSAIPKLTLKVIAPEGTTETDTQSWGAFENNAIIVPVLSSGENTVEMIYEYQPGIEYAQPFRIVMLSNAVFNFTELVNCEYISLPFLNELRIVSPDEDSSATLTITSWGG